MGLQLLPEEELFKSRLVVNYQDISTVKDKTQFSNNASIKKQGGNSLTKPVTMSVFDLKPMYPTDLSAKSFKQSYTNGNTKFKVDLKDGLKHGRYIGYHASGKKKITGRFKQDKQVGTWRYYDENGKQLLKKRF